MTHRRLSALLILLAVAFTYGWLSAAPLQDADYLSAQNLYQTGRFAEAASRFQAIVTANPGLVPAQVGLIHSLLRLEKVDEAQAVAIKALAILPNSGALVTAMGDVQFRMAEMPQAERSYLKAEALDPKNPAAYLGLVRVYRAYSFYRRAYEQLKKAYEIAPGEPSIQQMWFETLPRREQISDLQSYLSSSHPDESAEAVAVLPRYLAFLKATADQPLHSCRLVSKVTQTDTKLQLVGTETAHVGGTALDVKLNGRSQRLVIDTGSSGILVRRKAAEKAGLTRVAYERISGMGDKGGQNGYVAVADSLRIGELEFQDCLVRVADNAGPEGQDGLIGTDVFAAYLIDLDIPGEKLRLSPLPKRPNQATVETALHSGGEEQSAPEDSAAGAGSQSKAAGTKQAGAVATAPLPEDAYTAPEMAKWSKVYRFGHMLLIPTLVDGSRPLLFMIDTGAFTNILSTRAAREVTKVRTDSLQVRGMSGPVANVYRADKATLQFGHYYQHNQNVVTLDLTSLSRNAGTEVSGILGFEMLRILQVKIDYRDGLVDFVYDPKRLPRGLKLHGP